METGIMIYRSNLTAPDLTPYFRLLDPPIQMMGHDCPSDPDFDPECTYLTHDEGAILSAIASRWPGQWVDIGSRLGWSAAHLAFAKRSVTIVEPELRNPEFCARFEHNTKAFFESIHDVSWLTSEQFFAVDEQEFAGAMIDACHDAPEPKLDAWRAIRSGAKVLVWHDFRGAPIQDAVSAVMSQFGWHSRLYYTPNMMAVAWLPGIDFVPPDHVRDSQINWEPTERSIGENFDLRVCL